MASYVLTRICPIRNYNYYSPEDFEDLEEPIRLPKRLPDQECPRCGNLFPGGLKHCTACGLDMKKAKLKPESALPWPGYDRGLMICKQCNHANSDEQARRGRVQKCDLCHKVIYIPSGLHSPYYEPNQTRRNNVEKQEGFSKFVFNLQDFAAATFTRFWRSKAKWFIPLVLLAIIAGFALSNTVLKSKAETKAVADSPAMNYYQKVLPLRGAVTTTIDNFRITAGDKPDKSNFNYWRNPNNKERFVRACDDTIKSIENAITQLRVLKDQGYVPPEAVVHQNALLEMLYARQMYYARLKDGLNNNDQNLWNTAFDLKDKMNDTFSTENGALENLRDLVFNSKNAGK